MMDETTEVLADLKMAYSGESKNNCGADETAVFECLGCGNGVFRHVRDLRGRSLWECAECGNPIEVDVDVDGGRSQ